jgi:hypothetical protein
MITYADSGGNSKGSGGISLSMSTIAIVAMVDVVD